MGHRLTPAHGQLKSAYAAPKEVIRNVEQVMENLPTDVSAMHALTRKCAQEISGANVLVRDMEKKLQFNAQTASADDMETANNHRLAAALITSGTQGVTAAYQLNSSLQAATKAATGIEPQKEAQALEKEANALNLQATELEARAKAARTENTPLKIDVGSTAEQMETQGQETQASEQKRINERAQDALQQEQQMKQEQHKATLAQPEAQGAEAPSLASPEDQAQATSKKEDQRIAEEKQQAVLDDQVQKSAAGLVDPDQQASIADNKQALDAEIIEDYVPAEKDDTQGMSAEQLEDRAAELRKQAEQKKAAADEKFKLVENINAEAQAITSAADIYSKLGDAFGQSIAALATFGADVNEVSSKRNEASAQEHASNAGIANDSVQSFTETARDALQKMESIEQGRNNTNHSIMQNMR